MHPYIQQYINAVAKANGTTAEGVSRYFSVTPAVSQKMREAVRLESTFLQKINIISKTEIAGSIIGLSTGLNASRTDTKNGDGTVRRQPKPYHNLTDRQYLCKKVNFDTQVSYDDMDSWSSLPKLPKNSPMTTLPCAKNSMPLRPLLNPPRSIRQSHIPARIQPLLPNFKKR